MITSVNLEIKQKNSLIDWFDPVFTTENLHVRKRKL